MEGMTIKQANIHRFLKLCDLYEKACDNLSKDATGFAIISIQVHMAKGDVPKRYWKYANMKWRKGGYSK